MPAASLLRLRALASNRIRRNSQDRSSFASPKPTKAKICVSHRPNLYFAYHC